MNYQWTVDSVKLDYRNDGATEQWIVNGTLLLDGVIHKTITYYEADENFMAEDDVITIDGEKVDDPNYWGGLDLWEIVREHAINSLNPIWLARNAITEVKMTAAVGKTYSGGATA